MNMLRQPWKLILIAPVAMLAIAGCDNNDDDMPTPEPPPPPPTTMSYSVTMTNVTNNQVFSPVAVVLHTDGYLPWVVGEPVSAGLEMIAEGGDTGEFVSEADADASVVATTADSDPLMPGASTTLDVETTETEPLQISVATMLIRSNDGFTGVDAVSVADLDVDQSLNRLVVAYDAGTESNTETEETLVETGEGFNADRDDRDAVTYHQGVVTQDDGLADSFLDASHRWDNPVARITITRTN